MFQQVLTASLQLTGIGREKPGKVLRIFFTRDASLSPMFCILSYVSSTAVCRQEVGEIQDSAQWVKRG